MYCRRYKLACIKRLDCFLFETNQAFYFCDDNIEDEIFSKGVKRWIGGQHYLLLQHRK